MADQEAPNRQLDELLESIDPEGGQHRGDTRRRHYIQAIAALGLISSSARGLSGRIGRRRLPPMPLDGADEPSAGELSWPSSLEELPEGAAEAGGYSALLALASIGGQRRAADHPLLSIATAGVSILQTVVSGRELLDELSGGEVDAFSSIDAILSASTLPLVLPEAIRAVRQLVDEREE